MTSYSSMMTMIRRISEKRINLRAFITFEKIRGYTAFIYMFVEMRALYLSSIFMKYRKSQAMLDGNTWERDFKPRTIRPNHFVTSSAICIWKRVLPFKSSSWSSISDRKRSIVCLSSLATELFSYLYLPEGDLNISR